MNFRFYDLPDIWKCFSIFLESDTLHTIKRQNSKFKIKLHLSFLHFHRQKCTFHFSKAPLPCWNGVAGKTLPAHLPNPIRSPSFSQYPRIMTSSPSCKNLRLSPPFNWMDFVPFQQSSSIDPNESSVSPLIVPDAMRSPGRTLQPVMVWWANCWAAVQ